MAELAGDGQPVAIDRLELLEPVLVELEGRHSGSVVEARIAVA